MGVLVSSSSIRISQEKFKYFFGIRPTPIVDIQGMAHIIIIITLSLQKIQISFQHCFRNSKRSFNQSFLTGANILKRTFIQRSIMIRQRQSLIKSWWLTEVKSLVEFSRQPKKWELKLYQSTLTPMPRKFSYSTFLDEESSVSHL